MARATLPKGKLLKAVHANKGKRAAVGSKQGLTLKSLTAHTKFGTVQTHRWVKSSEDPKNLKNKKGADLEKLDPTTAKLLNATDVGKVSQSVESLKTVMSSIVKTMGELTKKVGIPQQGEQPKNTFTPSTEQLQSDIRFHKYKEELNSYDKLKSGNDARVVKNSCNIINEEEELTEADNACGIKHSGVNLDSPIIGVNHATAGDIKSFHVNLMNGKSALFSPNKHTALRHNAIQKISRLLNVNTPPSRHGRYGVSIGGKSVVSTGTMEEMDVEAHTAGHTSKETIKSSIGDDAYNSLAVYGMVTSSKITASNLAFVARDGEISYNLIGSDSLAFKSSTNKLAEGNHDRMSDDHVATLEVLKDNMSNLNLSDAEKAQMTANITQMLDGHEKGKTIGEIHEGMSATKDQPTTGGKRQTIPVGLPKFNPPNTRGAIIRQINSAQPSNQDGGVNYSASPSEIQKITDVAGTGYLYRIASKKELSKSGGTIEDFGSPTDIHNFGDGVGQQRAVTLTTSLKDALSSIKGSKSKDLILYKIKASDLGKEDLGVSVPSTRFADEPTLRVHSVNPIALSKAKPHLDGQALLDAANNSVAQKSAVETKPTSSTSKTGGEHRTGPPTSKTPEELDAFVNNPIIDADMNAKHGIQHSVVASIDGDGRGLWKNLSSNADVETMYSQASDLLGVHAVPKTISKALPKKLVKKYIDELATKRGTRGMSDAERGTLEYALAREGSLQDWQEDFTTWKDALHDGNTEEFVSKLHENNTMDEMISIAAFDDVMGGGDKNSGNWGITKEGKLTLIDNGLGLTVANEGPRPFDMNLGNVLSGRVNHIYFTMGDAVPPILKPSFRSTPAYKKVIESAHENMDGLVKVLQKNGASEKEVTDFRNRLTKMRNAGKSKK